MTFVLATGMLSALISCDSDLTVTRQSGNDGSTTFSAIMNSVQSGTRTSLKGFSTLWNTGDQILVNGTEITISQGIGTRYGIFKGTVLAYTDGYYYATYPTTASTFNAGQMTVTIPSTQTFNGTDTLLAQMPMAARAQADANGNVVLEFKNAANILKLNLWSSTGKQVSKIIVSSNITPLAGNINVNTSAAALSFDPVSLDGNERYADTLVCSTPVTLGNESAPTSFHILMPKLAASTRLMVRIYDATGDYQINYITVDDSRNMEFKNSVNTLCATAVKEFVPYMPAGSLFGGVSVSETEKILFSQGNLWRNNTVSTGSWHFEDQQYAFVGSWDNTHSSYFYSTDETSDNSYGSIQTWNTSYQTTNSIDWGGAVESDLGNIWNALSKDEWLYLLNTRTDHDKKLGFGTVTVGSNVISGFFILPDEFELPSGITFTPMANTNNYTLSQWQRMDNAGVIFLPRYGYRSGSTINESNNGYYWTSTGASNTNAWRLLFKNSSKEYAIASAGRNNAFFVRLITSIPVFFTEHLTGTDW